MSYIDPDLKRDIDELKPLLHLLSEKDESFAKSLIDFFEARGYLSPKQRPYLDTLVERARKVESTKAKEIEEIFNGHQIRTLLTTARANLKYPSLKLQTPVDGNVRFYIAGPLSRSPGYIIIDNGRTPPAKVVYGTIATSGTGSLRRDSSLAIKGFIRRIAANPVAEAKLCGIKFSHCCFCGLELTSPISLHHGYGPICADNWGLPWEGPKLLEDREKEAKHIGLIDIGGTES